MNRIACWLVALAAVVLFGLSPLGAQEPIKIGVILPLTGEHANFGEMEWNSFLMALDEVNQAGGIKGRKIELIREDDTGKPDVGKMAAEKLVIQDKVIALTGGYSSQVTKQLTLLAQQRKVPLLVTTGSADDITEQGFEWVFRIKNPVSEYTKGLENFLQEVVKPKSVAILYENTNFGQSGSKEFAKKCEEMGIQVLMKQGYSHGAVDFKPMLISVRAANPDFVYMISYVMDASNLMSQAKELDFNPKLFVGGGAGFTMPAFVKTAKEASEQVFSADLWTPRVPYPGAKEYFDKYSAKYNEPPDYHGAEAYASVQVLADVLKRAKDLTPDAVREALAATDMMTVYGPVKFISYGKKKQQNSLPTYVAQWQKGQLETVWPQNLQTKPYVYPVPPWSKKK